MSQPQILARTSSPQNEGVSSEQYTGPPPGHSRESHSMQHRGSSTEDFHEHFLLTPPLNANSVNPLDNVVLSQAPAHSPPPSTHFLNENFGARKQNAKHSGTAPPRGTHDASSLLNGLHIKTDMETPRRSGSSHSVDMGYRLYSSASAASLPRRIPSVRAALYSSAGSISPGSVISSPQIAAMLDITPLPSPTIGAFEAWKTLSRTRSRGSSVSSRSEIGTAPLSQAPVSPISPRRKGYPGLISQYKGQESFDEEKAYPRSVSEYVPEALAVPRPRPIAVSGTGAPPESPNAQNYMQREEFLGVQRGLISDASRPSDSVSDHHAFSADHGDEPAPKRPKLEVFTASRISTGQIRRYESIRMLGQGTFSKVYLAVRHVPNRTDTVDYMQDSVNMAGVKARSRRLVAVKVVEQGPAGGADAERVEVSLKREVELLKAVQHPSLVHLKAIGKDGNARALLVMNYCPGGDLFELASTKLDVLTPPLVRRIFSELVSAVRYLHQKYIVHRDIKLENVLLNIPVQVHPDVKDWQTLDRAVVTLTDLGLSRRIPEPPESPLLETRCGSEDYAAPEILMGQPYDGRQTDAWALGVLLYALMEGRLPFDPLPGARGDPATLRARTPHRIARCEWAWVKYGDEDGDWDEEKGKEMQGAFSCVDGLLKRNTRRMALAEIRDLPWVRDGVQVDGGLRWVEEEAL